MKSYKQSLIETISDEQNIKVRSHASAGVITKLDDSGNKQILLIQRAASDHWPHHWEFPRGKCDHGDNENPTDCLRREVKEETGLDINIEGLIDKIKYLADNGTRLTTCYNFLCTMKDPNQKIKLSKEHQDYKWISEVGEAEMLSLPDQKKTIEKVLNSDRAIVSYPSNDFTDNEKIEERKSILETYLRKLC